MDGMNSSLVKDIETWILLVRTYLRTLSFSAGIFSNRLKNAVVVPLRRGDKHYTGNCSPIVLLCLLKNNRKNN